MIHLIQFLESEYLDTRSIHSYLSSYCKFPLKERLFHLFTSCLPVIRPLEHLLVSMCFSFGVLTNKEECSQICIVSKQSKHRKGSTSKEVKVEIVKSRDDTYLPIERLISQKSSNPPTNEDTQTPRYPFPTRQPPR